MSIIANILWILLGGILIFFQYLIGGLVLCLTIIGIPFGVQCFKLSLLALVPFGRKVVPKKSYTGVLNIVMNIIWILIGGIWIAITHIILAIIFAVTIIGIPFAKQHAKLASLALTPFGKEIK